MINRDTAKQFLEVNGYPNPDSNFENEMLDTMVDYALEQVKNNDLLHSVIYIIQSNFECENHHEFIGAYKTKEEANKELKELNEEYKNRKEHLPYEIIEEKL